MTGELPVVPLPSVMKRLRADTGVAPEVLRRMTSSGLNRELEEACHHLFSDAIRNRHAGWRSRFPIDGPFQSGFVAANTKVASLIGQTRRDSWRLSSQDERTGPGGLAKPAPPIREKPPNPPAPAPERQAPATAPVIHHQIARAVQFALDAHGPLPTGKLRARQRRAVLRKPSAAAVRSLNQEAWRGFTGPTPDDQPTPSLKKR